MQSSEKKSWESDKSWTLTLDFMQTLLRKTIYLIIILLVFIQFWELSLVLNWFHGPFRDWSSLKSIFRDGIKKIVPSMANIKEMLYWDIAFYPWAVMWGSNRDVKMVKPHHCQHCSRWGRTVLYISKCVYFRLVLFSTHSLQFCCCIKT